MKYKAFVSHSREDADFALRLHTWLEEFRVPEIGPDGNEMLDRGRRLGELFLDKAELAVGTDLDDGLKVAIEDSEFFIVICSQFSSRSKWVGKEIAAFLAARPPENMLGILAPGAGYSVNNIRTSRRFAILNAASSNRPKDRLIADPAADGEENAFLRLTAGLLGVGFNDLVNRHSRRQEQERRARRRLAAKVHTLPAREAFAAGNPELALKHALASILDGDDPSWSQAFELEATVAEYAWSLFDLRLIRCQTGPDKSLIFDAVVLTECRRYILAGTKRGEISVWDSETGKPVASLQRREQWRPLPRDQQETDPSARSWHHPILAAALSPDRCTLVIAHGDYTATMWSTGNWRQIGFVEHGYFVPNVIVFSGDSSKVAITCGVSRNTGSFSDWIHIVDCQSGRLLARSEFRSWNVGDLTLGPGGEEVVIGSLDGAILRLNATTGKIVAVHHLGFEDADYVRFSPDGKRVLFVAAGGPPLLWEQDAVGAWIGPNVIPHGSKETLTSGKNGSSRTLLGVTCSPDWRRAYVAGGEPGVCLWDLASREKVRSLSEDLTDAQFSSDGSILAVTQNRTAVRLYSALTGDLITVLEGKGSKISLPFSGSRDPAALRTFASDNGLIAVEVHPSKPPRLDYDEVADLFSGYVRTPQSIGVYDIRTGSNIDRISRSGASVEVVGFSASGRRLLLLIDEHELRVRDLRRSRELQNFKVGADGKKYSRRLTDRRLSLADNGRYLAVADRMRRIRVFNPISGATFEPIELTRAEVANFAFGLGGDVLVLTCSDGTVKIFDTASGRRLGNYQDHPDDTLVDLLVVSPDGTLIATASAEDTSGPVVVRDLSSNPSAIVLAAEPPQEIRTMAFSANSDHIVFTDVEGEVAVWDIGSRRETTRGNPGLPNRGIAVSLSQDGLWIFAADAFGQVRVYAADTGDLVREPDPSFTTRAAGLKDAEFTADGRCLVVAERTNIQLIYMESARRVVLGDGDEWPGPPFAISPSGRLLATNSADGAVRLWRTDNAQRVCVLKGHSAPIAGLEFSSNEAILATMDVEGNVLTWDIRTASLTGKELTAWLCDRLKGDLAVIYGRDLENMLLRDLVHPGTGFGLNLVEEILNRWPELKQPPVLKAP